MWDDQSKTQSYCLDFLGYISDSQVFNQSQTLHGPVSDAIWPFRISAAVSFEFFLSPFSVSTSVSAFSGPSFHCPGPPTLSVRFLPVILFFLAFSFARF